MSQAQLPLPGSQHPTGSAEKETTFADAIRRLSWNGRPTQVDVTEADWNGPTVAVETFTNEFWTSKQRAANSLHEISYRACFKPQLVDFFVERLTEPGDLVYDPFMGRGTTLVESALLDRSVAGCDVNPLSRTLVKPRLTPPILSEVRERLNSLDLGDDGDYRDDLTVFYRTRCETSVVCGLTCVGEEQKGRLTVSTSGWKWSRSIDSPVTRRAFFPSIRCRRIRRFL